VTSARTLLAGLVLHAAAMPVAATALAQAPAAAPEQSRTAANLAKTHRFAQCLVRAERPMAVRMLEAVPGSSAERNAVAEIRRRGRECAETVARYDRDTQYLAGFTIAPATLRGPLAEALYESDFAGADSTRPSALADVPAAERIAGAPGAAAPTDVRRFAYCVAGNAPDTAASWLSIEPGSATETEAVRRLVAEFDLCFPSAESAEINIPTVRGFLAEGAYRHRTALARGERAGNAGDQIAHRGSADSGAVVIVPVQAQASAGAAGADGYHAGDVRTLLAFSRCIARRRAADAVELLSMDYREEAYDRTARAIATRSVACATGDHPRFSRLLFAGGLAEELLADRLGPGGLSAAVGPAMPAAGIGRDSTEAIALCAVRSQPGLAARLLATEPASAEENRIVRELTPQIASCVPAGQVARISQPSLRALTAIAAYRLVQQQAAPPRPARN